MQKDYKSPNVSERLDALYAAIPRFSCKKGCHDCCGPVFGIQIEADRLPFTATIAGLKGDLTCGFWGCGGCTIYANRPLICRLFGVGKSRQMQCPHTGHSPVGPLGTLDDKQERAAMKEYFAIGKADAEARGLPDDGVVAFFTPPDETAADITVPRDGGTDGTGGTLHV